MEKRYQVFVSSTFQDLQEARQEVMQALLELDCIPAGMELFPAANEDQWSLIKKVIEDCDYYIVIIAGRYGSLGNSGFSYTEMEYRYACEIKKPVIAFIHENPGAIPLDKSETDKEKIQKLSDFKKLVGARLYRKWSTPSDLGSQVSRSLIKLIKTTPAIGWVKADNVPDVNAAQEILRLKNIIENLSKSIDENKNKAPAGTDALAKGHEQYSINFKFLANSGTFLSSEHTENINLTWDDIFGSVAPIMIDESSEDDFKKKLNDLIRTRAESIFNRSKKFESQKLSSYRVNDEDFQKIKVQLRALGLIIRSDKKRVASDTRTFWTLTSYGDGVMTRLLAIHSQKKSNDASPVLDSA